MTAFDALRVSLPVGTVSGAPKVRAMQIIDELEPTRRGPYGGAVGYVDFAGNMDTCIALRTIVWKNGVFDVQAGAGVVADSVPADEYEETMNKAKAMLKAVEIAQEGLLTRGEAQAFIGGFDIGLDRPRPPSRSRSGFRPRNSLSRAASPADRPHSS